MIFHVIFENVFAVRTEVAPNTLVLLHFGVFPFMVRQHQFCLAFVVTLVTGVSFFCSVHFQNVYLNGRHLQGLVVTLFTFLILFLCVELKVIRQIVFITKTLITISTDEDVSVIGMSLQMNVKLKSSQTFKITLLTLHMELSRAGVFSNVPDIMIPLDKHFVTECTWIFFFRVITVHFFYMKVKIIKFVCNE